MARHQAGTSSEGVGDLVAIGRDLSLVGDHDLVGQTVTLGVRTGGLFKLDQCQVVLGCGGRCRSDRRNLDRGWIVVIGGVTVVVRVDPAVLALVGHVAASRRGAGGDRLIQERQFRSRLHDHRDRDGRRLTHFEASVGEHLNVGLAVVTPVRNARRCRSD